MFLGGIKLPYDFGFKAHSDGDVLIHSVIDALLGAIGAGDIGEFFPDTDEKYKGIDSKILLEHIITFLCNVGYEIVNIDLTIIAQKPKINPFKKEKMGFIGREEGIAVQSIATVKYYNWKNK